MKNKWIIVGSAVLLIAQIATGVGHMDPQSMQVMSRDPAEELTIDGRLDLGDTLHWDRHFFDLGFGPGYTPVDAGFGVTNWEYPPSDIVPDANGDGNDGYTDTSTAIVKFLHHGTDLYIALQSDDESVCKRFPGWEGDGLFMKVKMRESGALFEYKLFYVNEGVGDSARFEMNGPEGSGEGASYEFPGTITNDNTAPDSGYTLEMVIHLDILDPTYEPYDSVWLSMMIFDMDFYVPEHATAPDPDLCDYFKSWWGSEWGTELRCLLLGDLTTVDAYQIPEDKGITIDGQLSEDVWENATAMTIGKGSQGATGWYWMQWGDTLNEWDDPSTATIKFLHDGTDLYLGIVSDDSSVCEWGPGWEADGLFLWMRDPWVIPGPGERHEVKLMYFGNVVGDTAKLELSASVPSGAVEGKSYEPPGTVTHADTGGCGPDHGYSLELVLHTDMWGYVDGDSVWMAPVIWDMDHSSWDVFDEHTSDYVKSWWGCEWADINFDKYYMYRQVYLSPEVGIAEDESGPKVCMLRQNYPNPFSRTTAIRYELPRKTHTVLKVYSLTGQVVKTLVEGNVEAGIHTVYWDGTTDGNMKVANGVYFYRIKAEGFSETRRMLLVR
ncbi:hypothetical protein CH333_02715 [candidate division WOR-3 bacterium JGI_Cruoil_03_44_89]|uniref:FlgD/Vpr Ig-like domain-containing protein n=1 Tax=candidate division WOR-3 bacterium JGI_Cruoil_03_44_89 TaxID=1973748 RepID=A0A235BX15_UNCW3|nr:MAG: hypothetical protein CH333_02715 [candidate division WOR-3 bacterium JGI_Cruoil_03_44_89]